LGPYFITGTDHQAVVRGRAPRHRGVFMGRVERVLADATVISAAGVKAGSTTHVACSARHSRNKNAPCSTCATC